MRDSFDLLVVGGGPAGYSCALRAAELGLSVAVADAGPTVGGTCLLRGCIPTKALVTATRTIDDMKRGADIGIDAQLRDIDFGKLRDYRLRCVSTMTSGLEKLMAARRVTLLQASAELSGDGTEAHLAPAPGCEQVYAGPSGAREALGTALTVRARDVALATGSRPQPLDCAPFSGALLDSTGALELDAFPHSAIIIGSGAVALEFASIWNSAGCDTTLLIRRDRVLSSADRRSALAVTRELKARGVNVIAGTRVTGVARGNNLGATVGYEDERGDYQSIYGEVALAAIGRIPNTDAPWIASLGLELNERGEAVTDGAGRTNLEHVRALGDITAGPKLAHHAFAQGIVVAESLAGLDPAPVDEMTVPTVVFSNPEFASVGLTKQHAAEDGRFANVRETAVPVMANARMAMTGSSGSCSVVTGEWADDPGVETVLGLHVVAPDASDLIAEAQQLIAARVPLQQAAMNIHAHPTFSEIIGEALLKAAGKPLNVK